MERVITSRFRCYFIVPLKSILQPLVVVATLIVRQKIDQKQLTSEEAPNDIKWDNSFFCTTAPVVDAILSSERDF